MKKIRILIVEDVSLVSFKMALESENFEVIHEQGYTSALKRIEEEEFDIALLDINLADYVQNKDELGNDAKVGGFRVAEKIRFKTNMPIIFISAYLDNYIPENTSYYKEGILLKYQDVANTLEPFTIFDKKNLLKPTAKTDLIESIKKAFEKANKIFEEQGNNKRIIFNAAALKGRFCFKIHNSDSHYEEGEPGPFIVVDIKDVAYIRSYGGPKNRVEIVVSNEGKLETYIFGTNIGNVIRQFERILELNPTYQEDFFIQSSRIINLTKIKSFNSEYIDFSNDKKNQCNNTPAVYLALQNRLFNRFKTEQFR